MGRVSAKGVLVGGIVDIVATFLLAMPLMMVAMVQLDLAGLPERERTAALIEAMSSRSSYYYIGLGLGSLCSILGGIVAARIAGHDERLNGALSAWLCLLSGLYSWGTGDAETSTVAHAGYLVLSPSLGAFGGYLQQRSKTKRLRPEQSEPPPEDPRLYARFYRRFQALVVDSAVYGVGLIALLVLVEMASGSRVGTRTVGLGWLGLVLLYEPVLVAWRGATVGHAYANIRVVDLATGANPGFLRALGRVVVKGLLGLVAFIFMALTRHHQALHDLLFRTAVVVRDPSRASGLDYVTERLPVRGRVAAPVWRRLLVILSYSFVCLAVFGLVLGFTESRECFEEDLCSAGERTWETLWGVLWLGAQAGCLVFGWRGGLWGARSRAVAAAGTP